MEPSLSRLNRVTDEYRQMFHDAPHLRLLMAMGLALEDALARIESAIASGKPLDLPDIPQETDI